MTVDDPDVSSEAVPGGRSTVRGHHFVVLDLGDNTPRGAPQEPIEVAALDLRHEPGRGPVRTGWSFTSFIRPPTHARIMPFNTAQTGITAEDVADVPRAAMVLGALDQALPGSPVRQVVHHAPTEAAITYVYRDTCPRLCRTRIVGTRPLARRTVPGLPAYNLDALLAYFGIPQPARRHRAMDIVTVIVDLFHTLLTEAARSHSIAELVRVASRIPRGQQ